MDEWDPLRLAVFHEQILLQCRSAQVTLDQAMFALQHQQVEMFFIQMQNFLTHAANLSKAFWGEGGRKEAEREPLRRSLDVADDSPLRSTSMRNNFEHFDERLDRWWTNSSSKNYAHMLIGPVGMIAGLDDQDVFRYYDPTTHTLIFWGKRYELKPVVNEISRVFQRVESSLGRVPPPPDAGRGSA